MNAQESHVISVIDRSFYNKGLDAAAWLARDGNFYSTFENGDVMLFESLGDGVFHVDYLFETARGKEAMGQVTAAFDRMFSAPSVTALVGLTPVENRPARLFNRWMGCKSTGFLDTPFGPCEKFTMTRQMWKAR